MRIVLFSGLDESTPPPQYGSVETLAHCVAKELTALGHQVTVFATENSADALSFCEFQPYPLPCGMRHLMLTSTEEHTRKLEVMRYAVQQALALEPDVIHNNDGYGVFAWSENGRPSHLLTTAHWPFDTPVVESALRSAPGHRVLTISHAQKSMAQSMHFNLVYLPTVYNCIMHERFLPPGEVERGERLSWVGRFHPMKGPEEAIAIARLLDKPLVMAGKVDNSTKEYFDTVMVPLFQAHTGLVECVDEVSQVDASRLMASSSAFLMTSKFFESCPLAPMEALAAGTPVVSTNRGALPELVSHGTTGFVVPMRGSEIDTARFAAAARACSNISHDACRTAAERFRPARMAKDFEAVYETILSRERRPQWSVRRS